MRRVTSLSLLLTVFLPLVVGTAEEKPPSSTAIHQTVEQLWRSRRFAELSEYVQDLQRVWGGYVPVELTLAIYSSNYGGQVEDEIQRLKVLRSRLRGNMTAASPVFMELLDSRILRKERHQGLYLRLGISREQRLAERDPLKKTNFKHGEHWEAVDEMLYFNAPEVFLTEQGVSVACPEPAAAPDPRLKQKDTEELLQSISDGEIPIIERKAFIQELVRRRGAAGVANLVQSLWESDCGYTCKDTVEALVQVGPPAIPELIECINDAARAGSYSMEPAIWALVRIGVADPSVIKTLETISSDGDRAKLVKLAKYAQDALEYLQAKNR